MSAIIEPEALGDAIGRLGVTLLHFLWQGIIVALGLAVVRRFIKKPETQYLVSVGALLVLAACPVVTYMAVTSKTGVGGEQIEWARR